MSTDKIVSCVNVESPQAATYEDLALEYYDKNLHPTCSNFREGSLSIIDVLLKRLRCENTRLCEVGAGRSFLCELGSRFSFNRPVLVDSSATMLQYSVREIGPAARYCCANARSLPLDDGSIGLLVSSLGDPYNERAFWSESFRVLNNGGYAIYTTPSVEWADSYRHDGKMAKAIFRTSDNRVLSVPSLIFSKERQIDLVSESGLSMIDVVDFLLDDLTSTQVSSKIVQKKMGNYPIVTGFLIQK